MMSDIFHLVIITLSVPAMTLNDKTINKPNSHANSLTQTCLKGHLMCVMEWNI